jgi:hypothetical protein
MLVNAGCLTISPRDQNYAAQIVYPTKKAYLPVWKVGLNFLLTDCG